MVEPIRKAETVRSIGEYLRDIDPKYYVMFAIGIYSGLRISDILKLKTDDVKGKKSFTLCKEKTGKERQFLIHPQLTPILEEYCKNKESYEYLIPSPVRVNYHISRTTAYAVIHKAGIEFGLYNLGTDSLKKTYKQNLNYQDAKERKAMNEQCRTYQR